MEAYHEQGLHLFLTGGGSASVSIMSFTYGTKPEFEP
jgi:hypothetical protein